MTSARNISLIPYACGAGASNGGTEQAVGDLQQRGLGASGAAMAWMESQPVDNAIYRNLPKRGTEARKRMVLDACARIRDQVKATVARGNYPVTMGGDHSMAVGSIGGLAQALGGTIGVIWIDAHADLNTPATSPSQALHGMPVAALLGKGDPDFVAVAGKQPVVRPEHVFYLGLRDLDPGEWEFLKKAQIGHLTMEELRRQGMAKGFAAALEAVSKGTDHIVVSLDLDAFDPSVAPSVGSPAPGGFTREELLPALRWLMERARPAMFEIAEYNPAMGGQEKTVALVQEILGIVAEGLRAD